MVSEYMNDYAGLKPGLYLQVGGQVKALSGLDDAFYRALTGRTPNELAVLASSVGWVFIALNKRRTQMRELFRYGRWLTNGDEREELPFVFEWEREVPRIDAALQMTGQAYLFKQRRGRRVVGLRWLDPDAVQPDDNAVEVIPGGVRHQRYFYTPRSGQRETIPAEDMVHFVLHGRADVGPGTTAGAATKLAGKILYGIGEMFSVFYENNALPVMLIEVPMATSEAERERMEGRFYRLFNLRRGSKENRTVGVREGVKVTPLSINPESLDAIPLETSKIQEIVTAHDVPYEIVATAANYAVSQDRRRDFVGAIGQRLEDIMAVLEADPDFRAYGLTYEANVEQHWAMKRDEADAAIALQRYVQAGLTAWAAAWIMGISEDDFPDDIRARGIWADTSGPAVPAQLVRGGSPQAEAAGDVPDVAEQTDEMKAAELAQFRRWYKKRPGADVTQFSARYITHTDKVVLADEFLRNSWEMYP